MKVIHIPERKQLADILTKQFSIDQFKTMLRTVIVKEAGTHK